MDYQKAAQKYDVSYSQVYAWVRKYQTGQEEALRDHRGHKKPVEKRNEQERLKLRIKELEARNEYLEMENAFAKKVGRDRATKTTLTLVRHVERYQSIQELHREKRIRYCIVMCTGWNCTICLLPMVKVDTFCPRT
ncbi:helix-turn-helix domain-containing protein [Paenibacillus sp. OK003]|uniref:helix-turn-helix domain-containing protein n=1 Tax=Paenibacillus sp. OK003 TaxID=1884380 RepID=UPI0034A3EEEB